MGRIQQQARRQQQIDELCSAALRALTGDTALHLRGSALYRGRKRIALHAPHLKTDPERDRLSDHRGASDGMALRLLYSDAELHRTLCPDQPIQRLVFELLEQLRVESLVPADRPGMAANLRQRVEAWSLQLHHAGLNDGALGLLLYTLAQMVWARLNGCAAVEQTEDLIEATRAGIAPLVGTALATLKRQRSDQAAYAEAALQIARMIGDLIAMARAETSSVNEADDQSDDEAAAFQLLIDFEDGDDAGMASVSRGRSRVFDEADSGYRVFTARYDREVDAASLVRPALLRELREQLDQRLARQGINQARLTRQLAALYAQPVRDGWSFGEAEGYIDGRRLAQLVSSPTEHRLFQQPRHPPRPDCLFSFLIDCSGSMKEHIDAVALLVDVFGRALDRVGIGSEILGFTTGAWNGGRALQDWMAAGRPRHPGRLNEVMHLVYKDAASSWRRARPGIAAMLKPDLFREGVDGEAVDWAVTRLLAHEVSRRVLVVISDGCPMDTATKLANDQYYLDNHLKEVIARHTQQRAVQIFGLGVGLDLGPYYRNRLALNLTSGIDTHMLDEIIALLRGASAAR